MSDIRTKIKICGLKTENDISYVNQCKPDYVGFVFAKSKRQITQKKATQLRGLLHEDIIPVGVFVNKQAEEVAKLVNMGVIDIAQLHGDEDSNYIKLLRQKLKRGQIIKAVRVQDRADIEKAKAINADYILFDAYSPGQYGGTGEAFQWELLKDYGKPFFLAGGINAENVCQAIKMISPYAVDVSSSVETDGVKDVKKIMDFVKKVREEEI